MYMITLENLLSLTSVQISALTKGAKREGLELGVLVGSACFAISECIEEAYSPPIQPLGEKCDFWNQCKSNQKVVLELHEVMEPSRLFEEKPRHSITITVE